MVALLQMSNITGGLFTIDLRSLNSMRIISNWNPEVARSKLKHLITKDEVGIVTIKVMKAKGYSE